MLFAISDTFNVILIRLAFTNTINRTNSLKMNLFPNTADRDTRLIVVMNDVMLLVNLVQLMKRILIWKFKYVWNVDSDLLHSVTRSNVHLSICFDKLSS